MLTSIICTPSLSCCPVDVNEVPNQYLLRVPLDKRLRNLPAWPTTLADFDRMTLDDGAVIAYTEYYALDIKGTPEENRNQLRYHVLGV